MWKVVEALAEFLCVQMILDALKGHTYNGKLYLLLLFNKMWTPVEIPEIIEWHTTRCMLNM